MPVSMDTSQKACAAAFGVVFLAKYTKTLVGIYTYLTFKPRLVSDKPKYTAADVSVIVPTCYEEPEKLKECVDEILKSGPAKVFVVCHEEDVPRCKILLYKYKRETITVLGVHAMNKRVQILTALKYLTTDIVVLADDDVFWPDDNYLNLLLAIFEDEKVGAGGTRQRVRREKKPCKWNFLGIGYLERRTWNNATTNAIDGSISTLSGRTAAYRAEILQTKEFEQYFLNDSWRGVPLNSDDDKCLTRYVYKNGWKIAIQFDPRAVLETTVEVGNKYIAQCMRWARAHWRGNCTVKDNETYWRSRNMLWGMYVIYFGSYLTPAIFWEGLMWVLLWASVDGTDAAIPAYIIFGSFIFFSKLVKYIPHFCRHPMDLKFVPVAIAFSYYHGYLNILAYFTMTVTHWGSKAIVEKGINGEDEVEQVAKNEDEVEKGIDEDEEVMSAARRSMLTAPPPTNSIEFATAGQQYRFSENGRDHFRKTVPGAPIMSKEAVQKYQEDRAMAEETAKIDAEIAEFQEHEAQMEMKRLAGVGGIHLPSATDEENEHLNGNDDDVTGEGAEQIDPSTRDAFTVEVLKEVHLAMAMEDSSSTITYETTTTDIYGPCPSLIESIDTTTGSYDPNCSRCKDLIAYVAQTRSDTQTVPGTQTVPSTQTVSAAQTASATQTVSAPQTASLTQTASTGTQTVSNNAESISSGTQTMSREMTRADHDTYGTLGHLHRCPGNYREPEAVSSTEDATSSTE